MKTDDRYSKITSAWVHFGPCFRYSPAVKNLFINFETGEVILVKGEEEDLSKGKLLKILKAGEVDLLRASWKYIEILDWKKSRSNKHVLDGSCWKVEISCDGETYKKSGVNAYPKGWLWFIDQVEIMAGLEFSRGFSYTA